MTSISYARHQFPPSIIQHAVWLYLRFTLSYRDVEDLLAERGLDLSYETVRRWVTKFGPRFARELRKRRPRPSGRWHMDEMVVMIRTNSLRQAGAHPAFPAFGFSQRRGKHVFAPTEQTPEKRDLDCGGDRNAGGDARRSILLRPFALREERPVLTRHGQRGVPPLCWHWAALQ
jgi:hypothetical protein